jgi:hypothetical protein
VSLKEFIQKEIVQPQLDNYHQPVKAKVLGYNEVMNRATIQYKDSFQPNGYTVLSDVPVQLGSGGVHSAGPFYGDEVWVTFLGGDVKRPTIVALVDEGYAQRTRAQRYKHSRKGSYIADSICGREDW